MAFEPFGFFDCQNPNSTYFSLDEDTVSDIRERNPSLEHATFHIVRRNDVDVPRPYLVINSCLIWPVDKPTNCGR